MSGKVLPDHGPIDKTYRPANFLGIVFRGSSGYQFCRCGARSEIELKDRPARRRWQQDHTREMNNNAQVRARAAESGNDSSGGS